MAANRVVRTDQLADRVWADRPSHHARNTLYGYVNRVRKILTAMGDVEIVRQAGGDLLKVDEASVDLHRYRALVAQARAADDGSTVMALFEQAEALWRGEAFAGIDIPWLNEVRASLGEERFTAELDHTDLRLRHGRHAELVTELTARAGAHPWDERLAGQLMLALYRSGRQADALTHHERTRKGLAEELGIDPAPGCGGCTGRS